MSLMSPETEQMNNSSPGEQDVEFVEDGLCN